VRPVYLGLDVALRALQASQQALETTSHNIANANTPGYSRQEALLSATAPYTVPTLGSNLYAGQIGTGVTVTAVRRYRDAFLDLQVRQETQNLSMSTTKRDILQQIELILPEPSDSGLSSLLDRFWDSWDDLSNQPQSSATRTAVRQEADNLCAALNHASQQLTMLQSDQDTQIQLKVQEINSIAQQIAALNQDIQKVQITGNNPNDLQDQRDLLLDRLSQLTNATYREGEDGIMSVFIGGTALVYNFEAKALTAEPGAHIRWADSAASAPDADISGGELGGIFAGRQAVVTTMSRLDQLATGLSDAVNFVHQQGFGLNDTDPANPPNRAFFTGAGAGDIALSADILASADNIAAASAPGVPGDGSKAAAITALRSQTLAGLDNATVGGFYASLITQVGSDTQAADDAVTNQDALVQHLENQRGSLSGVSLDEEATNLIKYQRAYQAAARVMTTVDEMLDRLINGTGRVGL
jgi:flagellar hook-associated protein 1